MRNIYCPKCDRNVEVDIKNVNTTLRVKGVEVVVDQQITSCPICGISIADEKMTHANLDAGLDAYRSIKGLLSSEEIKKAYSQYGLTQGTFAKLLCLGAVTLSRYEHGAIQTKQIDNAIRHASEPANMISLLEKYASQIPAPQMDHAMQIAKKRLSSDGSSCDNEAEEIGNLEVVLSCSTPSILNGFRSMEWNRVTQMALFFSANCKNLGRIKLNKAMFYADFACFAATSCSMSGLVYARATFGPVVDNFDALFGKMVKDKVLQEIPFDFQYAESTVYKPIVSFDSSCFSNEELEILNRTVEFINSFNTAAELSEYSHHEKAWFSNSDGNLISYINAFELSEPERFYSV